MTEKTPPWGKVPSVPSGLTSFVSFAAKTEDRRMYDQREKAQRDHQWALESARELGREEGRELGRELGREEGLEIGALVGTIQLLRRLLGEHPETTTDLRQRRL